MSGSTLEEEIKEHAHKVGATVVGIASVEDVNHYAPDGHRPGDILRGARSVVVVGCGVSTVGTWRAASARAQSSVAFNRSQLPHVVQQVASFIERRYGHYSMVCPGGIRTGRYPYISVKLLAEMAGLATRSMAAGIVLNPTQGLLYYGAAVTTMPLRGDGPLREPVCPHPSCVKLWKRKGTTPCLEACPTCLSGELEDDRIKWMEYRQDRCVPRVQMTATDAFQKLLIEAIDEPDREKRKAILLGSHFTRAVRSMSLSAELTAQCFECIRRCPVGSESRHLPART